MKDLVTILKHIEDLYGSEDVSEHTIWEWTRKYPERFKAWQDGLNRYSDEDIISVIDEYWRFKDNKFKPRLVHIQAMLNTQKIDNYEVSENKENQEKLARQAEKTKEELRLKMLEKWGV